MNYKSLRHYLRHLNKILLLVFVFLILLFNAVFALTVHDIDGLPSDALTNHSLIYKFSEYWFLYVYDDSVEFKGARYNSSKEEYYYAYTGAVKEYRFYYDSASDGHWSYIRTLDGTYGVTIPSEYLGAINFTILDDDNNPILYPELGQWNLGEKSVQGGEVMEVLEKGKTKILEMVLMVILIAVGSILLLVVLIRLVKSFIKLSKRLSTHL